MHFKIKFALLLLILLCIETGLAKSENHLYKIQRPNQYQQLVLVIGESWKDKEANLWCFEKDNNKWKKVCGPYSAVVGKNGLAWDSELKYKGIIKKEGDSKSPVGIFPITKAFGFSDHQKNLKIPYIRITNSTLCVDDYKSKFYNKVIDLNEVDKDWNSAEEMRKIKQYKFGLIIGYNKENIKKPIGSCIFMHVWKNKKTGTEGCTAISKKRMEYLISWLDIEKNPVLVQLPESEYKKLHLNWDLP